MSWLAMYTYFKVQCSTYLSITTTLDKFFFTGAFTAAFQPLPELPWVVNIA